jgi:hypothetical protein
MTEINAYPTATAVDDADYLIMHRDGREASQQTRKVARADFLAGVGIEGEDADFAALTADSVAAPEGAIDELTVTTSLTMGAALSKILTNTASVAIGTLAAGASADVTMTVTGAVVGDVAILNPQVDMPDGLHLRPYVSGANTVTINVTNASTGSIVGASYSLKAVLLRVA